MQYQQIPLTDLKVSPLNVRKTGRKDGLDDLIESIHAQGILQPLVVRPNCKGFEIVAGQRRFEAAKIVASEAETDIGPLPCMVMEDGDDIAAVEASLAENIARLPMDQFDQFDAFNKLVKLGKSVEDIAASFGVSCTLVKQRLALANLLVKIKDAARAGDIDAETVRLLTRATKKKQSEWFKLFEDADTWAPRGRNLKEWLHGADISTDVALFDLETYSGSIVTDLFEENSVFGDADEFMLAQMAALDAEAEKLKAEGWAEVKIIERGKGFYSWEYAKAPMQEGGRVYAEICHDWSVKFHKGYITEREAKRRQAEALAAERGEELPEKPTRPELTKPLQAYLAAYHHKAAQVNLIAMPAVALRLAVAHMISSTGNWSVKPDHSAPSNKDSRNSVAESIGATEFERAQQEAGAKIDHDICSVYGTLSGGGYGDEVSTAKLFKTLLQLSDEEVLQVLAVIMAETLQAGSGIVEMLGEMFSINMASYWTPDDAYFDLLRDKELLLEMVNDIGGEKTAKANEKATGRTMKAVIRHHLDGTGGKKQVTDWMPAHMKFPMQGYTDRGGIIPRENWKRIQKEIAE